MPALLDVTAEDLRGAVSPIIGAAEDFNPLMKMIGNSHFVLLGEATHGTHEFYKARAEITKRLIHEKGFNAVAVEADWPDAYRVNRFIRGDDSDSGSEEALGGFKRFPTWMWRNADVLDFVGWLRGHNEHIQDEKSKVGFYGLDLYSLHTSVQAVLDYLRKMDPEEARRARSRYSFFEHFGLDAKDYARATGSGVMESCEEEVISQLVELRRRAANYVRRDGETGPDEYFFAEQNARLVKNAEEYYRCMYQGRASTWNLRDQHMTETLDALAKRLEQQTHRAKIVVWEHNSHLGDARATQMSQRGEINVGQLMRQSRGRDAVLVGFTTYSGSVTAASEWDEPPERKRVRPALPESYEALFHESGISRFFLNLRDDPEIKADLREPRLERAIGVIYLPESERISHYFEAHLSDQFDAVFHFDETRAVEPLERTTSWAEGEVPETYPSSL
jgi:erythromycin esterase-like protein